MLEDGGASIVDGRTHAIEEAIACARAWLSGASVNELVREMPFIDKGPRELRDIAERFDCRLRWEVVETGESGLWVYGGRRACCVDGETCGFLLGQAHLAFVEVSQDLAGAVGLAAGRRHARRPRRQGSPAPTPRGCARSRSRSLALAACPRSHHQPQGRASPPRRADRCSCHQPGGVPVLHLLELEPALLLRKLALPLGRSLPAGGVGRQGQVLRRRHQLSARGGDRQDRVALAKSPVEPFFGSGADFECRLVAESLARHGTALQPELHRVGMWSTVWLKVPPRRCRVTETFLDCVGEDGELSVACANVDDVVGLSLRFLVVRGRESRRSRRGPPCRSAVTPRRSFNSVRTEPAATATIPWERRAPRGPRSLRRR